MIQSLMVGLTEKDMQAVVNTYNYKNFYHPTLFPFKEKTSLTWKGLGMTPGLHIAADVVARGASIAPKTREAVDRLSGDIPKIAIKRIKEEDELNEYNIMLAMSAGNPSQRALVEAWAEDTKFCWDGVASRIEWLAMKSISRGKVTLTDTNNNSVVTEYDLDYQIDSDKKSGYVKGSWDNPSAKPLDDFAEIVKKAKSKGIILKYAFMNGETFAKMVATEQIIKTCASVVANILNTTTTPSLEQVNNTLRQHANLHGLQIIVLDQTITIEDKDHNMTTENPFEDNIVMFSETQVLGSTYWMRPADMGLKGSSAIRVMNGYTCIKKYAKEEPIAEYTVGVANAIPAWLTSQRSYLMDVKNNSWKF